MAAEVYPTVSESALVDEAKPDHFVTIIRISQILDQNCCLCYLLLLLLQISNPLSPAH